MNEQTFDVIIIGGGASGFFSACKLTELAPELKVCIVEKSSKILSKVKISGGGRCNLTHSINYNSDLVKHYPNGKNFLKKVFKKFSVQDTIDWFAKRGLETKVEEDGRMFPISNSSQSVIDVLKSNSLKQGVKLQYSFEVKEISPDSNLYSIKSKTGDSIKARYIMIATGGYPKESQFEWIKSLQHTINPPVPSLFTFNIPVNGLSHLKGLSVPLAKVSIVGEKLSYSGPLLITHWGLSGPAVLKLSAWGARLLNSKEYNFDIHVNWLGESSEENVRSQLNGYISQHPKRKVLNYPLFELPQRLWSELVGRAQINENAIYADLGNRSVNRLLENLYRMSLNVSGKTTFKEEFVTSGGVNLQEVDSNTMESKLMNNIYFTGEVLDIDGITGGFNFQAAWSTATVAALDIANKKG